MLSTERATRSPLTRRVRGATSVRSRRSAARRPGSTTQSRSRLTPSANWTCPTPATTRSPPTRPARWAGQRPIATLQGAPSGFIGPKGLSFNSLDQLIVANDSGGVSTYKLELSANESPLTTLTGASTSVANAEQAIIDRSESTLLVDNLTQGTLDAWPAGATGASAPTSSIQIGAGSQPTQITLDPLNPQPAAESPVDPQRKVLRARPPRARRMPSRWVAVPRTRQLLLCAGDKPKESALERDRWRRPKLRTSSAYRGSASHHDQPHALIIPHHLHRDDPPCPQPQAACQIDQSSTDGRPDADGRFGAVRLAAVDRLARGVPGSLRAGGAGRALTPDRLARPCAAIPRERSAKSSVRTPAAPTAREPASTRRPPIP